MAADTNDAREVPMIDAERRHVRMDLITGALAASAPRRGDFAEKLVMPGALTYFDDGHPDDPPHFVVLVGDWDTAPFVCALTLACVEHGLTRECRALMADARSNQLRANHQPVLHFGGWSLVDASGVVQQSAARGRRPVRGR